MNRLKGRPGKPGSMRDAPRTGANARKVDYRPQMTDFQAFVQVLLMFLGAFGLMTLICYVGFVVRWCM